MVNTGAPQGCVLSPCCTHFGHTQLCNHSWQRTACYQDNNQILNVTMTKDLIVDFRKKQGSNYTPLLSVGLFLERVNSFKYIGVCITTGLTWGLCSGGKGMAETATPQTLEDISDLLEILRKFYLCTIVSVLMWYTTHCQTHKLNGSCQRSKRVIYKRKQCYWDLSSESWKFYFLLHYVMF